MNTAKLLDLVNRGESSLIQFKREITPKQSGDIAAEMVAMSNFEGGLIIIGIEDKTGDIIGLNFKAIETVNNLLFNWASNNIKPAITIFTETVLVERKNVLVVTIPKGVDKPYCDKDMVFWIKSAANKRRVSPEELRRLYQSVGKLYAERQPIEESSIADIDSPLFNDFYQARYQEPVNELELNRLLDNLRLIKNDKLTLAGALLFGKNNDIILPAFYVSAVWFWGNELITDEYRSSRNLTGHLNRQFEDALNFMLSTLRHVQADRDFNSVGIPEIPKIVLAELMVNALIHRDYFINDSIKLFVFDNRIEIKSPGKLPNSLSVEDIKMGIQRRSRNVVLTSFANDILPYRGIGSGILKSLQLYPRIHFENNIAGEFFKVTIERDLQSDVSP
ncbi:MAG TPA: ATP-dependent DNA helicase RecG [Thiotrichaceae bacterium]|nr:ATP-dependent DNA helicase RecG [Thiotrichaceae bacterium]